jgi:hypothetical protein
MTIENIIHSVIVAYLVAVLLVPGAYVLTLMVCKAYFRCKLDYQTAVVTKLFEERNP